MKQVGIAILIIGLLITVFIGINFITKQEVPEIKEMEITHNNNHNLAWSPLIGIAVMTIGGSMQLFGSKKN